MNYKTMVKEVLALSLGFFAIAADAGMAVAPSKGAADLPVVSVAVNAVGGRGTITIDGATPVDGVYSLNSGTDYAATISAADGFVLSQVIVAGVGTNVLGESSAVLTVNVSEAATIVATFAPENAWFLDPFVRNKTISLGTSVNTYCASLSPDEAYVFMGNSPSTDIPGVEIFKVSEFVASIDPAFAPAVKFSGSALPSDKVLRGGAASSTLQLGIAGSLTTNRNWIIPFDGGAPYQVTHSIGAALDTFDFGANSAYLYAGAYTSGYRTKIYKLSFARGLAEGDSLTVEDTYDVASAGITRVRAISVETIGGKEYVYVAGGDGAFEAVARIDTATGNVTRLLAGTGTSDPMSVDVAGIANGTPRLYVGFRNGTANIYDLTADAAGAVGATPTATLSTNIVGAVETANVFTLDTEANAIVCAKQGLTGRAFVLERKPANLYVESTVAGGTANPAQGRVTVAYGAAAAITYAANEGYALSQVKISTPGVVTTRSYDRTATTYAYGTEALTTYAKVDVVFAPAASDDYVADDVVDGAAISAAMASWLNNLKSAAGKTKDEYNALIAADTDALSLAEEYLLNTDPTANTTIEFEISSIAVGSTVDIQVTLIRAEGGSAVTAAINGTLKIYGATTADGTYAEDQTTTAKFNGTTTAAKSFETDNRFFKAVIE